MNNMWKKLGVSGLAFILGMTNAAGTVQAETIVQETGTVQGIMTDEEGNITVGGLEQ